ncbi:MAG: hypothetical protein KKB30_08365 [Proteobacteria bacterium]|nr:hypothetical protein [Pseudomonadota bacterium]MBU1714834.1 hypothetical protein [Pseudomonadota bacterium]
MGFFDMFSKNKKDSKIKVDERKQNVLRDTAAAVAFAEAGEHDTARSMINKSAGSKTILIIGRSDNFSKLLTEYSLDMAQRLGFEILALNISDTPLTLAAAKREEATELFRSSSNENVTALREQAAEKGIPFGHLVEIGDQDTIVEKLHAEYPGMRYVLTEPDPEVAKSLNGRVAIPVFDLSSYHGAAA